jgi:hypothetical protein
MGFITILGMLRQGKSGQITLTVPKKFEKLVSIDKLVYIKISNDRGDLKAGETIHFDKDESII